MKTNKNIYLRQQKNNKKRRYCLLAFVAFAITTYALALIIPGGTGEASESVQNDAPSPAGNPFETYDYFIPENRAAYEVYQRENPDIDAGEVVWMVNVELNYPFYTNITVAEEEEPLLISKQIRLAPDFIPANLETMAYGHMATPETAAAFAEMRKQAMSEGYVIDIASAYRSYQYQEVLYQNHVAEMGVESAGIQSARPGHSEHQTGRALDITGSFGSLDDFALTPEFEWMLETAYQYGFILRYGDGQEHITGYQYEPWHYTFVGKDIAVYMHENNIDTLEEYVGKRLHDSEIRPMPSSAPVPRPEGQPLIVLDPGHGGSDWGSDNKGVYEKNINLAIALALQRLLEESGYAVYMVRDKDEFIHFSQRVDLANYLSPDLYVSIHQNAFEDKSAYGIETWYNSGANADSVKLAAAVQQGAVNKTGARDRGVFDNEDYYITKHINAPSCLIETGFLTNETDFLQLKDPVYQQKLASGIARGIDQYYKEKNQVVYLTFDDGPHPQYTDMILDELKARGMKATFFVVGKNVERYPEIAKRIVDEGHTIAIHCYSHEYKEIYASVDSYMADFDKAYEAVVNATGAEPLLFRFPGGSINAYNRHIFERIIDAMTQRGFIYHDWNVSLEDSYGRYSGSELVAIAQEESAGMRYIVLLAHDIVEETALAAGDIMDLYKDYRIEPMTAQTKPLQFPY